MLFTLSNSFVSRWLNVRSFRSLGPFFGLAACLVWGASGQVFRIDDISVDPAANSVSVTPIPAPGYYNLLIRGNSLDQIDDPFLISLNADFQFLLEESGNRFFRVKWISLNNPEDQDGDGIPDTFELLFAFLDPFDGSDADLDFDDDGASNRQEFEQGSNPAEPDQITGLAALSPTDGEAGVAVTRESIVYFTSPLQTAQSISPDAFYAEFAGERLPGRVQRSSDGSKLTLFYSSILPPSARIRVTLDGSLLEDQRGDLVDVDGDGEPGGLYNYSFDTLSLTFIPGTAVCGRVFASELEVSENGTVTVNRPLEGVVVTVDGMEQEIRTVTDQGGNFRLDNAPVGRFFVHIDGRPAVAEIPEGAYYPFVGKAWESIPGEEVNVGEVYLPLVVDGSLQEVSVDEDKTIEFADSVKQRFPEFSNVAITVPAGSLQFDDGRPGGSVGIAPVPPDRLPGQLPPGLNFPLVITVQTDGATNFDTPAPVCFPNLPDPSTGEPLPPGAKSALWSFNHDTGRFEVVGPMTVSGDGTLVCTDPGVGILAPGWHGVLSGVQVVGGSIIGGIGEFLGFYEPGTSSRPPNAPCPDGNCPPATVADAGAQDADPVHLFSGEFYLEEEDLRIKGRGMDFIWSRKYRSRIDASSALGNQWDYSFNIWIEEAGNQILLADGNSRRDLYTVRGNGDITREEFFNEFVEVAEGEYHLIYPDQGRWEFHPFNGNPEAGKLAAIVDRNGNRLALNYDRAGRLAEIVDTLDRSIAIGWNESNRISTVTDFTGRVVRYEYFGTGEAGGSVGDLKSVSSPAVTGTPNGNDFENGKTVSYTYSAGFSDPRLNHNLLTITDGRRNDPNDPTFGDAPFLVNVYSETTDSNDLNFDRVVRQFWGDQEDQIDFHYETIIPSNANGMAVLKTIVNDRNGNVTESFYDARNRITRFLEFTGRADSNITTTSTLNRPANRLRESDPAFFLTSYEWNSDSQLKRITYPNGASKLYVYEADLNPLADSRSRGNLRELYTFNGRTAAPADQEVLSEFFEYGDDFDSPCCGFNHVVKYTDARGHVTRYEYDDRGNRIRMIQRIESIVEDYEYNDFGQITAKTWPDNGSGHRRRDEYEYYSNSPQRGYIEKFIMDASGEALTTRYEYDSVGNLTRKVDPRGNDELMVYNQLDHIVRWNSRVAREGSDVRYTRDYFYDANNNLVRTDTANIDHNLSSGENTLFTEIMEYDRLNFMTRLTQEVDEDQSVVTEYGYDRNRNRTLVRYGEAVNGNQPGNGVEYEYDERNLLYRVRQAPGTDDQSTTELGYDANRNLAYESEGIESAPRTHRMTYDGFDRLVERVDPMGNRLELHYDPNHNVTLRQTYGELNDLPGSEANTLLSESEYRYDAMDRRVEIIESHFETDSQQPIGDGSRVQTFVFSDNSQLVRYRNDRGNGFDRRYDTMNRLAEARDSFGNTLTYVYDVNSNLIELRELENATNPDQSELLISTFEFDPLNRKIRQMDPAGQVIDYGYDSRNNLTYTADGRRLSTDTPGNIQTTLYDGLNRPIQLERLLTVSGQGGDAASGSIVTRSIYDDSSRLVGQVDPQGHVTEMRFDPLNRFVGTHYADGTQTRLERDLRGNVVRFTDANGTVIVNTYDELDRLKTVEVTPAQGVDPDVVAESYQYDGLSRLIRAADADATVERGYDSLSNIVRERINGQETRVVYDAENNPVTIVYPGGRTVTRTYDSLNRMQTVSDASGVIAENSFLGTSRLLNRVYRNQTRTLWGYDPAKRVTSVDHVQSINATTGTTLDSQGYEWDGASNKILTRFIDPAASEIEWKYDSIQRMTGFTSSTLEQGDVFQTFDLDPSGNRTVIAGSVGNSINGNYLLDNQTPEPADAQVHQYTSAPGGDFVYDRNGNLISRNQGGILSAMVYDFQNRMTRFEGTEYLYDPLGRRIAKVEPDGSETHYFYQGWQVIEEQDENDATVATYVYGNYLDDPISMMREGAESFYHLNDQYSVTLLTDSGGNVIERYRYSAFGDRSIQDDQDQVMSASAVGNPFGFQGRRLDPESGWYYYRNRYLDPELGRFTTRDPLGAWGDPNNLGNGYTFVGNNPQSHLDPMGLDRELVLGPHAYITVDRYNKAGDKIGTYDLHFAPEDSQRDYSVRLTRDRLFYHEWVVRIKVPSSREADQELVRTWRQRHADRTRQWNPVYNCWVASLEGYGIGAKLEDRSLAGRAYDLGEDIYRQAVYGDPPPPPSEPSIRAYEPGYLRQAQQALDGGLEYLEDNVAQPIVDFFDDPTPTLNSWGSTIRGWFK